MKRKTPKPPPGTEPRPGEWNWPPDIFWIKPEGVLIEVIGHLTAIQAHPETFGLASSPVKKREIDDALQSLLEQGWVRGRYSDGTFFFQMSRPRGTSLGGAHALVVEYARHAKRIIVDFDLPYAPQEFKAEDFIKQRFPASWGINPRQPRRRG